MKCVVTDLTCKQISEVDIAGTVEESGLTTPSAYAEQLKYPGPSIMFFSCKRFVMDGVKLARQEGLGRGMVMG
ncbi:hypothetical protein NDU88_008194 [Pleurodeles waltl]|uniref:Uncharacterized protein n=1 Tax=Pleurodeles waltl TaxID=8319 RepID=A0AAV7RW64_PLEWA|nr:hypothetical protein NDU88_008194 [Pleurodeles waltl]